MSLPILDYWRKCTTCKNPILFKQKYWICSISTCNRVRTNLVFCNLRCFDAHIPVLNHKDAGAYEKIAPSQKDLEQSQKTITQETKQTKPASVTDEILVVVSKVKSYIRSRSGMNTSDAVMEVLSKHVRHHADLMIETAKKTGRKII